MSMGWSGSAATPLLASLPGLFIRCSCGHGKSLGGTEVAELAGKGIQTTEQLKRRLRCSACEGKDGLDVVPLLRAVG